MEDYQAHWLVSRPSHGRDMGPFVAWEADISDYREQGWTVEGPFVHADDERGGVEAIKALRGRVERMKVHPDPRESAYAHGYQAAVTDALEALTGGR